MKWEVPIFFLAAGGCTNTCMVMTPIGRSPYVILESASVLLFSNILPACISFKSLTDFGNTVLSANPKTSLEPRQGIDYKLNT